ncbi:MAG: transcription-repair coupling factor (superfamily II helicase) [Saprospiraceae bacterium]|jgi:transcription-repair coupling factor (superfamily II helicase)
MPIMTLPATNLPGEKRTWKGAYSAGISLSIAELSQQHRGLVVVVASSARSASQIMTEVAFFLGDESKVFHLPDWETLPYDQFSPHQDIVSQRLKTLHNLPQTSTGVVVVPVMTMMHRIPPVDFVSARSFDYSIGDHLDLCDLRKKLQHNGYRLTETVIEHGEYNIRGSIIDIYPMGAPLPFRIDLFDNEIESLRTFDPDSQLTLEKMDHLFLLPAKEIPLDEESIGLFKRKWLDRFEADHRKCSTYKDVSNGIASQGIEYYLPLFFEGCATVFDYLPKDCLVITESDAELDAKNFWDSANKRYEECNIDITRPLLSPKEIFLPVDEFFASLKKYPRTIMTESTNSTKISKSIFELNFEPIPHIAINNKASNPLEHLKKFLSFTSARILFLAETKGRKEALSTLLNSNNISHKEVEGWEDFMGNTNNVCLTAHPVERGLYLEKPNICLITETELFGLQIIQNRRRITKKSESEQVIKNLSELRLGAPVVHIEHGVGRYRGLKIINSEDWPQEFISLEYANESKLYVPVSSLNLISRYSGGEVELAPMHRLGGDQWQKAKDKALKQISDTAVELLDIFAIRAAKKGFACKPMPDEYKLFCADFPFEETPDQLETIEATKKDMLSEQPMDRLVCGDVGFGKTEVAMRAAFIAVASHKQVVILAPTTLLVHQHVENFRDRFANWPIKIGELSRFCTAKDQEVVLTDTAQGNIDILIGTHKLLHAKINYKNLGLLIIDEEHRFGVKQKEKIKALRAEVDILTLTATPIPRTLNLSMSGIKDLSIIATPPAKRLSVKTFIRENNSGITREAVLREILRGGQVFYLHNEVRNIETIADELSELVPEAKVNFAHGQMRERDLEKIMSDFYHQRFNVLVCTTIIENGIDIPSANTILVNRADKFGLAQLHQLRGRVGRSHHQAYAYLLIPEIKSMTSDALKRLEAIRDASQLGSGFTLATHDLEIRGAGELLGKGQSGHIQSIGFNLYSELLEKAVKAIRKGEPVDSIMTSNEDVEVKLNIPALIPEEYLPDVHMRLTIYKRIANATSDNELYELQVEMIDRFGLIKGYLKNLFLVTSLKLHARSIGIMKLETGSDEGRVIFGPNTLVEPLTIVNLVQSQPDVYRFMGSNSLKFKQRMETTEERIEQASTLLHLLTPKKIT